MRTGWWPPDVEFDIQDLVTVDKIVEESNRNAHKR